MADETLRAKIYSVNGTTITNDLVLEDHVVDASLQMSSSPYSISRWDDDTLLAVWSSSADNPQGEITARSKAAFLYFDKYLDSGFTQETFDLPYEMPAQEQGSRLSTKMRLGETDHFVVGAGGGAAKAPIFIPDIPDPATTKATWGNSFEIKDWPDDDDTGSYPHPDVVEPYLSITSTERYDSFSAVELNGAYNGQVLAVWVDNYSAIKSAKASSVNDFLTTDDSLGTATTLVWDLTDPAVCVFRAPQDGFLYMIWASRTRTPASYHGTFPAPLDLYFDLPSTLIYKSVDEGDNWTYFDYIQIPDDMAAPAKTTQNVSWDKSSSANYDPSDSNGRTVGANKYGIIVGTPLFKDLGGGIWSWTFSGVRWAKSNDLFFGNWLDHTDQVVWHSPDPTSGAGAWGYGTWSFYSKPNNAYNVLFPENVLDGSTASRNVALVDGTYYWAMSTASNLFYGYTQLWRTTDPSIGGNWTSVSLVRSEWYLYGTFYRLIYNPIAPLVFGDNAYPTGAAALHMHTGGRVYVCVDGLVDGADYRDSLTPFREIAGLGNIYQNGMIQELEASVLSEGEHYIFTNNGYITNLVATSPDQHNGVHVYVVDRCSETSIY